MPSSPYKILRTVPFLMILMTLVACNGPLSLTGKRSPHQRYAEGLKEAGLDQTTLGRQWSAAATRALAQPVRIEIPYRETGYFAPESPGSAGFVFNAKKGERISISLQTTPANSSGLFLELWSQSPQKQLAYTDSLNRSISEEIEADGLYVVRLQPELLLPAGYTLNINSGPSLAFPVRATDNPKAASFWGADRDGGGRSHEGVDIFAKKGTDAIAIAEGSITRVNENRLGGKVVFLRPDGKNYSLYYAHLDSQLVSEGQRVSPGMIVGHIGNTGNARTTPAHLHFGIYTNGGAVDPWPFINPNPAKPKAVTADTSKLWSDMRLASRQPLQGATAAATISEGNNVKVLAAMADQYRVQLPDGRQGFIKSSALSSKPLRREVLKTEQALLTSPGPDAAMIKRLPAGTSLEIFSSFDGYQRVQAGNSDGWIAR